MRIRVPLEPKLSLRLLERIFGLGRSFGRGAEELHKSFAGGLACPLLEKLGCSFHQANLFGERYRDPLVQEHAIFFRQSLGRLLDGKGKLQWVRSFAHGLSFFKSSAGRSTEILNRSAGSAKSARLKAASAAQLTAALPATRRVLAAADGMKCCKPCVQAQNETGRHGGRRASTHSVITFRKGAVWPATKLKYLLLSIVARRPSRDLFPAGRWRSTHDVRLALRRELS